MIVLVVGVIGGAGYYLGQQRDTKQNSKMSPTQMPEEVMKQETTDTDANQEETNVTPVDDETGSISGVLGYPSEGIPPMQVYAFNTEDMSEYYYVQTAANQQEFKIEDVPAGSYRVVAYLVDNPTSVGGYSEMVPCGLKVGCNDHTLIDVEVESGEAATDVEVRDWYAPEGSFPVKP